MLGSSSSGLAQLRKKRSGALNPHAFDEDLNRAMISRRLVAAGRFAARGYFFCQ